jgi:hypothetical protein
MCGIHVRTTHNSVTASDCMVHVLTRMSHDIIWVSMDFKNVTPTTCTYTCLGTNLVTCTVDVHNFFTHLSVSRSRNQSIPNLTGPFVGQVECSILKENSKVDIHTLGTPVFSPGFCIRGKLCFIILLTCWRAPGTRFMHIDLTTVTSWPRLHADYLYAHARRS